MSWKRSWPLAVTTMIDKANDACHRELVALNVRFAHMTGKADLASEGNPVSPAMLAMAFREILQEWDSEVLARIVVYKCFDRVVLSRMKACYEAMNLYLAENGVLPLPARRQRSRFPPWPRSGSTSSSWAPIRLSPAPSLPWPSIPTCR